MPVYLCNNILNEIFYITRSKGWDKRHEYYPTVDISFDNSWKNYSFVKTIIENKIYEEINKLYSVNKNKINIIEMFIVKYSTDGQRELEYHRDGSEFSFIGLNDDYKGGGTTFEFNKQNIRLRKGSCLIFSGQNMHKGEYLLDGTRYILTGFLSYGKKDICQEYYKEVMNI